MVLIDRSGIHIRDLHISIQRKPLLNVPEASLKAGMLVALLGINGSGKSTLLRTILGLHGNYTGLLAINSVNLSGLKAQERAVLLSALMTHRDGLPGGLTVRDLLAMGRIPYTGSWGRLCPGDEDILRICASESGLESLLGRRIYTLSDGELQKALLTMTLVQQTPYILLDEPLTFLDYPSRKNLIIRLKALTNSGKGILFSTHDLELVLPYVDKVWLLDAGVGEPKGLIEKNPDEVIQSGILQRVLGYGA